MKFDKYVKSGDLYQVLNRSDKEAFEKAFSKKVITYKQTDKKTNTEKVITRVEVDSEARRWVWNVFDMTASKLDLPMGAIVQVFKLGNPQYGAELQKIHTNRVSSLDPHQREAHPSFGYSKMNPDDFKAVVRTAFAWALGLRKPWIPVHDSGPKQVQHIEDTES